MKRLMILAMAYFGSSLIVAVSVVIYLSVTHSPSELETLVIRACGHMPDICAEAFPK